MRIKFYKVEFRPCPTVTALMSCSRYLGFRLTYERVEHLFLAPDPLPCLDRQVLGRADMSIRFVRKRRAVKVCSRRCSIARILGSCYIFSLIPAGDHFIMVVAVDEKGIGNFRTALKSCAGASASLASELGKAPYIGPDDVHLLGRLRNYYSYPRNTSLSELAEELKMPKSTLSYRIRRAVGRLVKLV